MDSPLAREFPALARRAASADGGGTNPLPAPVVVGGLGRGGASDTGG